MTQAVQIDCIGGPEELHWRYVDVGAPGPREVRIRKTAVGLDFADVYMRTGNHLIALSFPAIFGAKAVGIVKAVGSGVNEAAIGDRVGCEFANHSVSRGMCAVLC